MEALNAFVYKQQDIVNKQHGKAQEVATKHGEELIGHSLTRPSRQVGMAVFRYPLMMTSTGAEAGSRQGLKILFD